MAAAGKGVPRYAASDEAGVRGLVRKLNEQRQVLCECGCAGADREGHALTGSASTDANHRTSSSTTLRSGLPSFMARQSSPISMAGVTFTVPSAS